MPLNLLEHEEPVQRREAFAHAVRHPRCVDQIERKGDDLCLGGRATDQTRGLGQSVAVIAEQGLDGGERRVP
jgi:hypothetical protein